MGIAMDAETWLRLLPAEGSDLLAERRYRSVFATHHALDEGSELRWTAQPVGGDAIALMLIATVPLRVADADGAPAEGPAGTVCFLHPYRTRTVTAHGVGSMVCAGVPWAVLAEIESGVRAPGEVIALSTLGRGLQAFLTSLLTEQSDPTVFTDHLVERLIAGMVFGVLVEAAPRVTGDDARGRHRPGPLAHARAPR